MKEQSFYYTASIMRGSVSVLRQGTLRATCATNAIDRVYAMGKAIWKKTIMEVIILDPTTMEVIATSKIGEKVGKKLLPFMAKEEKESEDETTLIKNKVFQPWGKPQKIKASFCSGDIGTLFVPTTFMTLHSFSKGSK